MTHEKNTTANHRRILLIKVTIELDSAISKSRDKILGIMEISSDGMLTVETAGRRADYDVKIRKGGKSGNPIFFECKIENFARKSRNVWDLIYLALEQRQTAKKSKEPQTLFNDFNLNDAINSMVSDKGDR